MDREAEMGKDEMRLEISTKLKGNKCRGKSDPTLETHHVTKLFILNFYLSLRFEKLFVYNLKC